MPIYEYRCTKGHSVDVMQSFTDEPLTKCQVCGAPTQRVLHAPSIHFKGSGFYNTDYGTRKRSREKEARDGAKSESSSSSDSSSGDSKSTSESSKSSETSTPSEPSKSKAAKAS